MKLSERKRIFWCLLVMTAGLGLLVLRLAYLQLFDGMPKAASANGRGTSEMAVMQREEHIELDTGRGRFVDASGRLLTGELIWSPVLFPDKTPISPERLQAIALILDTKPDKLQQVWSSLKFPDFWRDADGHPYALNLKQVAKLEEFQESAVKPLPVTDRYPAGLNGRQWLGFLAELPVAVGNNGSKEKSVLPTVKQGAAGLEKAFDPLLRGQGKTNAAYLVDAYGTALPGEVIRASAPSNPYYPLTIATTIDLQLQSRLEKLAVDKGVKEGAIVVLDAASRDIKAMVSLPFYNPNQVNPVHDNWANRAVKEAVPGSIFKLVTAAAALEYRVSSPGEQFICKGDYGKYGLSCWKKSGHGRLTLAEAFAQSCNTTFAAVGERLSAEALAHTADALGIGRTVGWRQQASINGALLRPLDQEEAGTVFGTEQSLQDGGVKAQTAIGQRNVRVSPLQAANLVATLLHNGEVKAPRLVSDIYYANGTKMVHFAGQGLLAEGGERISAHTAQTLRGWMRDVVVSGTGKKLQHYTWQLAGKSGTAQVVRGGKERNDQWFIGYGPYINPRYTAAVLVQSREPGASHLATEVFGEVMELLSVNPEI